ncbi:MAG: hypothetical protein ACTSX8_08495 [Alphaproteobacteria bacterium]
METRDIYLIFTDESAAKLDGLGLCLAFSECDNPCDSCMTKWMEFVPSFEPGWHNKAGERMEFIGSTSAKKALGKVLDRAAKDV